MEVEDFIRDIDIRKTEIFGGYVHTGFLQRANEYDYESMYKRALLSDKELIICGHSLGGAASILCTLSLLEKHFKDEEKVKIKCLNYGAPFCLSEEVVNHFINLGVDKYFLCVVHDHDIVPQSVNLGKNLTKILTTVCKISSPQFRMISIPVEYIIEIIYPVFYPFGQYICVFYLIIIV